MLQFSIPHILIESCTVLTVYFINIPNTAVTVPDLHSGSYLLHRGILCPYQHKLSPNSHSWPIIGFSLSRKRA